MTLELHSVLFPSTSGIDYERMARVLHRSAELNSPSTPLTIHRITDADDDIKAIGKHRKRQFVDNVRKTRHHARIVEGATDGQFLCLMDCDTMVVGDMSEAIKLVGGNDIAFTVRPPKSRFVFNSGVVFVRVSDTTRELYRRWYQTAEQMLADEKFHLMYKPTWGGINQSAFGYLVPEYYGIKLIELPCEIWNCEADTWDVFSGLTKVIHIIGSLRHACLRNKRGENAIVEQLAQIWRSYDARFTDTGYVSVPPSPSGIMSKGAI